MKAMYTATATSVGGRGGHVKSSDGIIDMELRIPKEMGGPGGEGTNPEQLFAAGYSACFNSALNHVARLKRRRIGETTVQVMIGIDKNESGGFKLLASISANIPGVTKDVAEELIQEAHMVCPYSNVTRGNMEVELHVTVE